VRGLPSIEDHERKRKRANGTCGTTGKLRYRTRTKAVKAPHGNGGPHRVYKCPFCKDWHVTKQDQQEHRAK
jgi:hypothetical protein